MKKSRWKLRVGNIKLDADGSQKSRQLHGRRRNESNKRLSSTNVPWLPIQIITGERIFSQTGGGARYRSSEPINEIETCQASALAAASGNIPNGNTNFVFFLLFSFLTPALLIGWPPSGALFNFPGKTRVETPRGWPAKEDRQSSGGNEDHFALDHCSMCTHIRDPHTRWLQLVILTHRPCRERDATLFLTTRPPTPCRRMLNHQSLPQTSSPPSAASQNRKRQHSFHIHTQTDTSNSVRHPSPPSFTPREACNQIDGFINRTRGVQWKMSITFTASIDLQSKTIESASFDNI